MNKEINKITSYMKSIHKFGRLGLEYCIAFVYNDENSVRDKIHLSECILEDECAMIMNAFREAVDYVYSFNDEIKFIQNLDKLKKKHKYICVYSMAQNTSGIGRRSLIPIVCDYFNLINIGADFMSSTLGGNKFLMYDIIHNIKGITFPFTYYIKTEQDIDIFMRYSLEGNYLLKPNDESASIGLRLYKGEEINKKLLLAYMKNYPIFCVQEFIEGREVAVPLLYLENEYLCPGISEVIFKGKNNFLDYDTVALGYYDFAEYNGKIAHTLIDISKKVAQALDFKAISRIDFRIKNNNEIYIEDIGSNPTISIENGVNKIFCDKLNDSPSCVYLLLLFSALQNNNLFKPSFN